jgi:hypothetical protein
VDAHARWLARRCCTRQFAFLMTPAFIFPQYFLNFTPGETR